MSIRRGLVLWLCALLGCTGGGPTDQPDAATTDTATTRTCTLDGPMHTMPCFTDTAEAQAFMALRPGPWPGAKVVLSRFMDAAAPQESWFMDPGFYQLHDEWYWFRLLNGRAIDGLPEVPRSDPGFATIADVYAWAAKQTKLPLDLNWAEKRLYSWRFYELGLGRCGNQACPRFFGLATLLYLPENPKRKIPEAVWGFTLEYEDRSTLTELQHFFDRLEAMLPPNVAPQLRWIGGPSPYQNELVESLRRGTGPLAKRVITWNDLIAEGEVQGYTQGITAGKIRKIAAGKAESTLLAPTDLVVLEDVPPSLPPVAGILTALPQTPQAHLNLLAAARGTPNAYASGAFADSVLDGWADAQKPIVFEVQAEALRWKLMSNAEWATWLKLITKPIGELNVADITDAPLHVDLSQGDVATSRKLVPLVGGKCAGLMALGAQNAVETPPGITCLTVRGYAEHLDPPKPLTLQTPLKQVITGLLADPEFIANAAAREVLLEGMEAYATKHAGDPAAQGILAHFKNSVFTGPVGDVLAGGGLMKMVATRPLNPAYEAEIMAALKTRFAALSPFQALRFRSSSTAEDIEGFNGAGVYISESAFLYPEQQAAAKDKARTVSRIVREIWASYWLAAAFEERQLAGIDHLQGRMAVAVHPRFDDAAESANGVALISHAVRPDGDRLQLMVDVQPGALSVTNPPPGTQNLPETDRVVQIGDQPPVIERVQLATVATTTVLSDEELLTMFAVTSTLAKAWLVATQAPLAPEEQAHSVTLDLEFRRVHAGWPMLADGTQNPPRLVWKQVRPLERVGTLTTAHLGGALIPRDVLHAGTSAVERTCHLPAVDVVLTEVLTDPTGPHIGGVGLTDYAIKPLTARVAVSYKQSLGWVMAGTTKQASWLEIAATHPKTSAVYWDVALQGPAGWGWKALNIEENGAWTLSTASDSPAHIHQATRYPQVVTHALACVAGRA